MTLILGSHGFVGGGERVVRHTAALVRGREIDDGAHSGSHGLRGGATGWSGTPPLWFEGQEACDIKHDSLPRDTDSSSRPWSPRGSRCNRVVTPYARTCSACFAIFVAFLWGRFFFSATEIRAWKQTLSTMYYYIV